MKLQRLLSRIGLVIAGTAIALLIAEATLRLAPGLGPKGAFGFPRFDPELGLKVHGDRVIYNKVRQVSRYPNSAGFLDIEHQKEKPKGIYRVGIFGDSYVESLQVPLEQTFFRRLAKDVSSDGAEVLAFGISGWGTLHSMMAYETLGSRFDLDLVIYVFVKNDPGDHLAAIQHGRAGKVTRKPAASLADNADGFTVAVRRSDPSTSARRRYCFL